MAHLGDSIYNVCFWILQGRRVSTLAGLVFSLYYVILFVYFRSAYQVNKTESIERKSESAAWLFCLFCRFVVIPTCALHVDVVHNLQVIFFFCILLCLRAGREGRGDGKASQENTG